MSHFTVLVVTDRPDEDAIEQALIPFQEHACTGECPKEYLAFNETETEYLAQWKTESREMYRSPEGQLFSPHDEKFRVPGTVGINLGGLNHKKPDNYTAVQIPFAQLYSTFEEFMREWAGDEERDSETGRYGYWENPNAKWDWWEIGGRWTDELASRNGGGSQPTDSCRVGDLDFEGMRLMAKCRAIENWKAAQADRADMVAAGKMPVEHINEQIQFIYGLKPGVSREDYLNSLPEFSTHAVLMDGKWYERGQMGWWGIVSYEDGNAERGNAQSDKKSEWQTKFNDLLKNLDPNKQVTVVDCHI